MSCDAYGLEPCPFCGCRDVVRLISAFCAVVECDECGATMRKNSACTLYKEGDCPIELTGVDTYDPDLIVNKDGKTYTELGYRAVSIPRALAAYGVTERWNRRS